MAGDILGRGKELHAVGRFLDSLTEGPSACVFEGEAGIGKTALWREGVASARAASLRVLSCAPAEVEAAFSYSSLADLLEGVEPDVFAALPAPQRDALEVALLRAGRADAVAGQRAVATAAVSVLGHLASSTPVVVAIDDVQWLDGATARVLEFAARRLEGRPVGFLLSLRTPSRNSAPLGLDRSLADERLERVRVGALSAGALHQLIKARLGRTFSRAALLRIHSATEGNPFFALELASSLQDAGAPAAGEALPVPDDVRALVASGLRTLPAPTREMLLTAAAMTNPTVGVLRRAVRASSKQMLARLAGAEEAGVIVVEGESVRFRHPLFASAIYAAASRDERHQAHRRLAALAANTEERARHLALCTEEPDGAIALTVAEAAGEVRRRGAPGPRSSSPSSRSGLRRRMPPASATGARSSSPTTSSRPATPNVRGGSYSLSRNDRARSKQERSSTSRPSTTGAKAAGPRSRAASRPSRQRLGSPRSWRPVTRSSPSTATSTPTAASSTLRRRSSCSTQRAKPPTRMLSSMRSSPRRVPVCLPGEGCRPTQLSARSRPSRERSKASIALVSGRSSDSG